MCTGRGREQFTVEVNGAGGPLQMGRSPICPPSRSEGGVFAASRRKPRARPTPLPLFPCKEHTKQPRKNPRILDVSGDFRILCLKNIVFIKSSNLLSLILNHIAKNKGTLYFNLVSVLHHPGRKTLTYNSLN